MSYFHFSYFILLWYTTALPPKRKIKPLSGLKPFASCEQGDTLWSKLRTAASTETQNEDQPMDSTVQCSGTCSCQRTSLQLSAIFNWENNKRHAHHLTNLKGQLQQVSEVFLKYEKVLQALILLILGKWLNVRVCVQVCVSPCVFLRVKRHHRHWQIAGECSIAGCCVLLSLGSSVTGQG